MHIHSRTEVGYEASCFLCPEAKLWRVAIDSNTHFPFSLASSLCSSKYSVPFTLMIFRDQLSLSS